MFASSVKRKRPASPEHKLQASLVAWHEQCVARNSCELIAIPNGGFRRKSVAGKMKAEGQRKGATDLVLALPEGRSLWIEVKLDDTPTTKRTDLSAEQRAFRTKILSLGHSHRVVRSIEQYRAVIEEFGVPHLERAPLRRAGEPRRSAPE